MAAAFAPPASIRSSSTSKLAAIDPSSLHDLPQHVDTLQNFFSSFTIADLDVDAVSSAAAPVVDAAAVATPDAVDAAATAAAADQGNGWFGFLTLPIESLLKLIHVALQGVGLSADAWGVSIIAMTVVIKALTFPLTKSQLESTNKMQALQPTVKALQAKYQSNPEVMNQKIAEVYQQNEVNPLAGCIPSLVQIPVFIGLYRAVLNLAKENALDEPFLFLPNLEGPTYGADPAHGSDWLFKNWVDGVPSLGWDDTIAFLSIPIFLTISQVISMQIMQPKTDDPQQQQANVILKVLPFMIGWFALNVPAALGVYWVVNNIVTTATTLYVRNTMPKIEPVGGDGAGAAVMEATTVDFNPTPMNERAVGFGGSSSSEEVMTTITPVDAEIVESSDAPVGGDGPDIPAAPTGKRGGGKKKKKRRKN
jgi:YidC/Oxa1 family membrane protein insertase